ncbi:hypothetical protein ACFOJ6_18530 [Gordonia humi]|uniref:hypothetical protein n=1 Tax=Gordonia humi TaxID=686429 RepID=UPI0036168E8B
MEIEELRRRLASMSGDAMAETSTLPVPEAMTPLFPRGGLSRGTVVSSVGATTVPMAIIAAATRSGATAALVGLPRLNLAAAMDMGADLSRVAVVTEPGGWTRSRWPECCSTGSTWWCSGPIWGTDACAVR